MITRKIYKNHQKKLFLRIIITIAKKKKAKEANRDPHEKLDA